jgi:hypothetical protein
MPNPNEQADLGLTDVERENLAQVDADGNPRDEAEAPAGDPPAAESAEVPAGDPPTADAPAPVAEVPPPAEPDQGAGVPFPTIAAGEARDFKAELAQLKEKYSANDLDDDEYEEQREQIISDRAEFNIRSQLATEFAEQSWTNNVQAFLGRQENAALLRSDTIKALWQTSMQAAVNNAAAAGSPLADDWAIMRAGRDLLFKELGLSATETPAPPPPPPPRLDQNPPMKDVPPSLSEVPAAAPSGAKLTAESLAATADIEEIERATAGMSEAQWDELLRSVPGAFVD